MGVILFQSGKPYVFEAVATVRFTPLEKWIERGEGGRFVVKRLKNARTLITPEAVEILHNEPVIAPGEMFQSPNLETVAEN